MDLEPGELYLGREIESDVPITHDAGDLTPTG